MITHQKTNLSLTCPYERQCKNPGTKGHTRTKGQVQGQGYTLPPYGNQSFIFKQRGRKVPVLTPIDKKT